MIQHRIKIFPNHLIHVCIKNQLMSWPDNKELSSGVDARLKLSLSQKKKKKKKKFLPNHLCRASLQVWHSSPFTFLFYLFIYFKVFENSKRIAPFSNQFFGPSDIHCRQIASTLEMNRSQLIKKASNSRYKIWCENDR